MRLRGKLNLRVLTEKFKVKFYKIWIYGPTGRVKFYAESILSVILMDAAAVDDEFLITFSALIIFKDQLSLTSSCLFQSLSGLQGLTVLNGAFHFLSASWYYQYCCKLGPMTRSVPRIGFVNH